MVHVQKRYKTNIQNGAGKAGTKCRLGYVALRLRQGKKPGRGVTERAASGAGTKRDGAASKAWERYESWVRFLTTGKVREGERTSIGAAEKGKVRDGGRSSAATL